MDITITNKASPENLTENTICIVNGVLQRHLNSVEDLMVNVEQSNVSEVLKSESEEESSLNERVDVTQTASQSYFHSSKANSGTDCFAMDVIEKSFFTVDGQLSENPNRSRVLKSESDEVEEFRRNKLEIQEMQTISPDCVEEKVEIASINYIVNDVLEKLLISVEDLLVSVEHSDKYASFKSALEEEDEFKEINSEEIQTSSQSYFDAAEENTEFDSDLEYSTVDNSPLERISVNADLILDDFPVSDSVSLDDPELRDVSNSHESLLLGSSDSDEDQFTLAQPSEEIGDRDELDDMEDMDFVERMSISESNELMVHRHIFSESDPDLQGRVDNSSDSDEDSFVEVRNLEEHEIMDNLDFMQRMEHFFREADTLIRTNHGSGDYTWMEPDEEELE